MEKQTRRILLKLVLIIGILIVVFAVMGNSFNRKPSANEFEEFRFDFGKLKRNYYVYPRRETELEPSGRALIVIIHGYKGSAASTIKRLGRQFNQLADENDLVIAYPNALGKIWKLGGKETKGDAIDLKYFQFLLKKTIEDYSIDENRIYLVGESQGAMASYAIACSTGVKIRALVAVAMPQPEISVADCLAGDPLAFALYNGTGDKIVDYWGGEIIVLLKPFGSVLSTPATIDFWQRKNGCMNAERSFEEIDTVEDDTIVELQKWVNCEGAPMLHARIVNGGHTWPDSHYTWYEKLLLGRSTRDIKFVESVWSFLSHQVD